MTKRSNHVVPSDKQGWWAVKKFGTTRVSKTFERKQEAVQFGRELSRKESVELYIHKKDGSIQERNIYGKDPLLLNI